MKKTETIDPQKEKKSRKLVLILALLGIILLSLALIGLVKFGTVLFFVPFWFWTVDKIIELTGANLWLARGFAALFVLPFFYLIKLIFSWKAGRRRIGWILFSLLTASLCFAMFFLSEDIYFSFKTGQAKKWYIVTPAGEYKFSDSPGYNTFWGIEYQQVTPEVIRKYVEREREGKVAKTSEKPENKEVIPIPKENIPEKKVEQIVPEKVAAPQQATPTEIIPEKTAVVEGEKEKAAKKPTFKIVPKETISEETAPKKVTSKETKTFSLSPEEERLLVEEIKKRLYPESLEDVEKLFETILLLDEAGSLSKYNDLLCSMVRKNLNREMPEKGAICCLAKVRSEESIPTLIWAFANTKSSYERDLAKRAIEVIKKGEEIDLKSSLGRGRGFSFPSCSWITIVPKTSSLSGPE